MSEILFARHAQTDMAGRFCGHSDPELNAAGRLQLSRLIEELRAEKVDEVYSSDLRRARETASEVAREFGVSLSVRSSLREIDFGEWEGLYWEEIEARDGEYARRWMEEYPQLPAPGGERFSDFERRVLDEVDFLCERAEGRKIAVVTHAGVMRVVLRALHGCSEEDAWEKTRPYCCMVRHVVSEASGARQVEVGL
ncbi:histidine phosphatase family protein [Granulicella sp. L60]|uniref:histidine phosphatase family protein n=1 Tax=Granulicella sp. L60 TaxID=1641866 RepID=UPI00157645F3|nr:histidine phosphatase family protein [Granulicella sp. L60]